MDGNTAIALAPAVLAAASAIAAILIDAFGTARWAARIVVVGLAAGAVVGLWSAWSLEPLVVKDTLVGGIGFSGASGVILLMGALAVAGGMDWMSARPHGGAVAALIAFGACGAVVLVSSMDLVMILLALETIAVCAYALVSASRTRRSAEAAMKYLVQGAVAAGLFLVGLAVVVGVFGSARIGELAVTVRDAPGPTAAASLVLFICALAFKLGAVPFHGWAPDAFETAPASASAFLSGGPKLAAGLSIFLITSVVFEPAALGDATLDAAPLFAVLATASIVIGNLAALSQRSYTRMLGYSGIAQVGYALVGLVAGSGAGEAVGILLATYALASCGAFLVADAIRAGDPSWDGSIEGMSGLAVRRPVLAAATAVAMFSLTGIPLMAGFWGKLLVFSAAVSGGHTWLAIVGVLGSVVSFGYYGGVIRRMYLEEASVAQVPTEVVGEQAESPQAAGTVGSATRVAVLVSAGVLALGVIPLVSGIQFLAELLRMPV